MSDLSQSFVVNVDSAAATANVTVPFDADLVGIYCRANTAGTSTQNTVDVQVNGTTVIATGTVLTGGDAGATITSNKIQLAGDSATVKSGVATAQSSVRSGMTNQVTNNVTSGIDFWTPVAPADAVLKACKAGDLVTVITTLAGGGTTKVATALHFVRK